MRAILKCTIVTFLDRLVNTSTATNVRVAYNIIVSISMAIIPACELNIHTLSILVQTENTFILNVIHTNIFLTFNIVSITFFSGPHVFFYFVIHERGLDKLIDHSNLCLVADIALISANVHTISGCGIDLKSLAFYTTVDISAEKRRIYCWNAIDRSLRGEDGAIIIAAIITLDIVRSP